LKFEFERYLAVYRGNRGSYPYRSRAVKIRRSVKKTLVVGTRSISNRGGAGRSLSALHPHGDRPVSSELPSLRVLAVAARERSLRTHARQWSPENERAEVTALFAKKKGAL
jgi:hypothetical protein